MLSVLKKSIYLIILSLVLVYATPQLVIENDDRTVIEVAEFGFLKGGQLTLTLDELKVNNCINVNIYYATHINNSGIKKRKV
jgi:hypothetical protein